MALTQQVPPIARGYHYALQLGVATDGDPPFPAGAVIVAQLRDFPNAPIAAQLSTADGTLYRVDDHHLQIQAPASATAGLSNTTASIDFVRTDGGEPEWMDIGLRIPVLVPVTQLGVTAPGGMGASAAGATTAIVISDRPVTLARCAMRITTVGTLSLAPIAIPSGASVGTPSITAVPGLAIAPAAIGPGSTVPAPVVGTVAGQQIAPGVIASTVKVGAPAIATAGALGIGPSMITSTASVGSPKIVVAPPSNAVTYSNNPVTYNGSAVTYG